MKYRVTARNLYSFEEGQIVDEADLVAKNVPIERRIASGHLEPVLEYSKKPSTSKKESD